MPFNEDVSRRKFLKSAGLLLSAVAVPWSASGAASSTSNVGLNGAKPLLEQGIQIGDVRAIERSSGVARTGLLECLWNTISTRDSPILSEFVGLSLLKRATIPCVWT